MAVAQRLDGGLDDVLGRAEIGLADAEIDDVAALGGELGRPRQHREGVLLADAVEGRDGFQHVLVPPGYTRVARTRPIHCPGTKYRAVVLGSTALTGQVAIGRPSGIWPKTQHAQGRADRGVAPSAQGAMLARHGRRARACHPCRSFLPERLFRHGARWRWSRPAASGLQQMAEEGRRGARQALALADNPGTFLSSVQVGITLIGILSGAFGGATLGRTPRSPCWIASPALRRMGPRSRSCWW